MYIRIQRIVIVKNRVLIDLSTLYSQWKYYTINDSSKSNM